MTLTEGQIIERKDGAKFKVYHTIYTYEIYVSSPGDTVPEREVVFIWIYPASLDAPSGFQLTLLTKFDLEYNFKL